MSRSGVVRDSARLALASYLSRAVVLARGLVAAVVLGPAGFGTWNALSLVLDYGGYSSVGALHGLDLRLPAAEHRGDRDLARRLVTGAWVVMGAGFVLFGLIVAATLVARVPALTAVAGAGPGLVVLLAAAVQVPIQVLTSALKARGTFDPVSESTAIQAVLGAGLGLALVGRFGLWGLAAGWLAGSLAALARLRAAARDVPLSPGRPRDGIELSWVGLPVFGAFLASLLLRSVDRLALVRFAMPDVLGLYSLGLMAAGLVLYVPEAAAAVLYPRITAAAGGALDEPTTRAEVVRMQRALTVLLPLAVGLAMVWVAPVVGAWLPRFRAGTSAVRLLAFGALLLSAATVPTYWLLGRGRAWTLLAAGLACAAATAMLVFTVAARTPRPGPVATAACIGYAGLAVTLVTLASRDLVRDAGERLAFLVASLLPAAWAGAAAFAVCGIGPAAPVGPALARSVAVALAYAPVLWWFGRGLGLRGLLREALQGVPARVDRP